MDLVFIYECGCWQTLSWDLFYEKSASTFIFPPQNQVSMLPLCCGNSKRASKPWIVTPPFLEGDNGNKQQTRLLMAGFISPKGGCTSCVGWHADIPASWRVRPDSEECHRISLPLQLLDKPHMDIWGWPNKWKHAACLLSAYVSLIRWLVIFTFLSVCKEHLRVVEWLTQSTLNHYHYVCCLSWGFSSKWALPSYIYHFTQRKLSSAAGSCGITCSFTKGETFLNNAYPQLSRALI